MSFYGQPGMNWVWFVGIVEDVDDPAMLGRMKVRMINEQDSDEVPTEDLLWATAMSPIQSASLNSARIDGGQVRPGPSATGASPTGVEVGSKVIGFYFDGEERNQPVVIGSFHTIPQATKDDVDSGAAAQSTEHDVSALARETQSLHKEEVEGDLGEPSETPLNVGEAGGRPWLKEPESAYEAEYPYNKTFTTRSGHAIEIDDTPGAERIHVYHRTGTYTEINKDGRLVQKTVGSDWNVVMENKNILVKGDYNIEVDTDATILVQGNVRQWVGGSVVQAVEENVTQTVGKNVEQIVGEDATQVVGGNISQTILGNSLTEIEGDQEIIVHGDLKYAVDGNVELLSKGTMKVQSVGQQDIGTDADQRFTVGGNQDTGVKGDQNVTATETNINNDTNVTGTVDASVDVLGGNSDISLVSHTHNQNNGNDNGGGVDTDPPS